MCTRQQTWIFLADLLEPEAKASCQLSTASCWAAASQLLKDITVYLKAWPKRCIRLIKGTCVEPKKGSFDS